MVESGVSLTTFCQFLYMIAVSCLLMSEKGVTMGRKLVSVCGVRWHNSWFRLRANAFFMFLMMRCSGMREQVKCVLGCWVFPVGYGPLRWSYCIEMLVNKWYLFYSWMDGESGSEIVSCSRLVFYRVSSYVFWFQKDRFTSLGKWQFVRNRWICI